MSQKGSDSFPGRITWFFSLVKSSLNQFSKDEEARFRLMTGLKLALLQVAAFVILVVSFYYLISLDLVFFKAFGLNNFEGFQNTFYEFILCRVLVLMPIFFGVFILAFVIGIYLGHLLLRPFRLIGEYCESRALEKTEASYDPGFLTDLKLLTRFSEYFFSLMDHAIENKNYLTIRFQKSFSVFIHRSLKTHFFFSTFSASWLLLLVFQDSSMLLRSTFSIKLSSLL